MDQMGYEKGLIRYTTENSLQGKPTNFLRPRLIGYGIAVLVMVVLFTSVILTREPLRLDVIRDRDRLYSENSEGMIENSYTLKVINMDQVPRRYKITVSGLEGLRYVGDDTLADASGEVVELPIRLSIDPAYLTDINNTIEFSVESVDSRQFKAITESRFIGPRI